MRINVNAFRQKCSGGKCSQADLSDSLGFFVEQIELDMCVKCQVNQTNGLGGGVVPPRSQ